MPFQFKSRAAGIAVLVITSLVGGLGALLSAATGFAADKERKADPASAGHPVSVTRQLFVPKPPQAVFAFITAEDVLPKVLTGYGPLPGVVRTSQRTGAWNTPGSSRIVHLADGNTVREQITAHTAPGHFRYRVWDFSDRIISSLATDARGEMTFVPQSDGTLFTWTYTFNASNAAAAVPLTLIVKLFWRGYMDVCLENTTRLLTKI